MVQNFTKSFTQQEPIPEVGITTAIAVMQSGRLHRYNTAEGERAQVDLLEQEFAAYTGAKYCLGVASGGYALSCALRTLQVQPGDKVLTNAFTLAPVPGAIANLGAQPVFIEVDKNLTIDLQDLDNKIKTSGARVLMLSHMRGHICNMDALMAICNANHITVIEDCAHTMGAAWNGVPSGRHGLIGCYSTQTYKHINSGEGGLLITDDPEIMARATMLSGSYMLYASHGAGAAASYFEDIRLDTPNCSGRMDNLRAAILRPQLAQLETQVDKWNALYAVMERALAQNEHIALPKRPQAERYCASSFQFRLPSFSKAQIETFITSCKTHGVELKWFGADQPVGFTSRHDSWRYAKRQNLPQTDRILSTLLDMRLPLTFNADDCALIAEIIREQVTATLEA